MIRLFLLLLILVLPLHCFSYDGAKVAEPTDTGVIQKLFISKQWRKKLFVNGSESVFVCRGEYRKYQGSNDKQCRLVTDEFTGITKKAKELPLKEALLQEYQRDIHDLSMDMSGNDLIATFTLGNEVKIKRDADYFDGLKEPSNVESIRAIIPVFSKITYYLIVPMLAIHFILAAIRRGRMDDSFWEGAVDSNIDRIHQSDPLNTRTLETAERDVESTNGPELKEVIMPSANGTRKVILD